MVNYHNSIDRSRFINLCFSTIKEDSETEKDDATAGCEQL
jgi:hypothetical protein